MPAQNKAADEPFVLNSADASINIHKQGYDYGTLVNLPALNGQLIVGNKTGKDYGLADAADLANLPSKEEIERLFPPDPTNKGEYILASEVSETGAAHTWKLNLNTLPTPPIDLGDYLLRVKIAAIGSDYSWMNTQDIIELAEDAIAKILNETRY